MFKLIVVTIALLATVRISFETFRISSRKAYSPAEDIAKTVLSFNRFLKPPRSKQPMPKDSRKVSAKRWDSDKVHSDRVRSDKVSIVNLLVVALFGILKDLLLSTYQVNSARASTTAA